MATIVVGIDGSEGARAALAWACRAAHQEPDSKIVAVSTWLSSVPAASPWFAGYDLPMDLTEITRAELEAAVASVEAERGTIEIEQRVVCGSAAAVLIAEGVAADMLVVGSRGVGGFKGLLLGSVSNQVVAHAQCPTVIVPRRTGNDRPASSVINSIVVGVDGSANSIAALQWAARFARGSGATVRAIYVWRYPIALATTPLGMGVPPPEVISDTAVEELQGFIADALPSEARVEAIVREGSPAQVLLEEGSHADLLVVGARGHEGFVGLLLGSVTTAVAHHAPCPLAVIPEG